MFECKGAFKAWLPFLCHIKQNTLTKWLQQRLKLSIIPKKDIVYFHYQWCIVDNYIYFVLYIYLTAAVTSFLYKLIFYI